MKAIELILSYCDRGLKVFPVYGIDEKGQCACGKESCEHQAKHPRVRKGFKAATDDQKQIMKWWNKWPDSNVGIRTGSRSDPFAVDVDGREGQSHE
jgi:hypothetical protein